MFVTGADGRLLESSLTSEQISKLKGTGKGGMLTKGDVLVALGKIKNSWGSAEKLNLDVMGPSGKRKSEVGRAGRDAVHSPDAQSAATAPVSDAKPAAKKEEPLDAAALRRLIVAGMSKATRPAEPIVPQSELAALGV